MRDHWCWKQSARDKLRMRFVTDAFLDNEDTSTLLPVSFGASYLPTP